MKLLKWKRLLHQLNQTQNPFVELLPYQREALPNLSLRSQRSNWRWSSLTLEVELHSLNFLRLQMSDQKMMESWIKLLNSQEAPSYLSSRPFRSNSKRKQTWWWPILQESMSICQNLRRRLREPQKSKFHLSNKKLSKVSSPTKSIEKRIENSKWKLI